MLTNGLAAHRKERDQLIATITGNAANTFSKTYLEARTMEDLKGLAALAAKKPAKYDGQGDPAPTANADEEPLPLPTMNFGQ